MHFKFEVIEMNCDKAIGFDLLVFASTLKVLLILAFVVREWGELVSSHYWSV